MLPVVVYGVAAIILLLLSPGQALCMEQQQVERTLLTYTLGSCDVTKTVTVGNAISPITGTPPSTFCVTSSITLSDATAGGTWSSSNPGVASVTGTVVVHGVSGGTATISYTVGSCSVTQVVNVDPK